LMKQHAAAVARRQRPVLDGVREPAITEAREAVEAA
jgi:hypothetical protein